MGESQKNVIDGIIARMREACCCDSDLALGWWFGSKSRGLVSNWRRNEEVPEGNIALVAVKCDVNFKWLLTGEGSMRPPPDHFYPVAVIYEEMAPSGDMTRRLREAWPVASEEAQESAVLILENSARRSPGKGVGDTSSTRKKSA